MSDSAFLLSVLSDGLPHSQSEILRRSIAERGCGLTVHSRAADLRRRGYVITCDSNRKGERGERYLYTLLAEPSLIEPSPMTGGSESEAAALARPASAVDTAHHPESEEQASLSLFDQPKTRPAWA